MVTDEQLDRIRSLAYESASEPAKWSLVLDAVRTLFGATSSHLRGAGHEGELWWVEAGLDPATKQGYAERWGAHDPWRLHPEGHARSRAGRCFIGSQILPWPELERTEYYNEFGRFAGTKGVMSAMIEDALSGAIAPETKLALFREASLPEFEDHDLRAFQSLQPSFRRAVNGYWAFRFMHGQASIAQEALELQPQPIYLVGADLTIRHCNSAASAFCTGRSGSVTLGRLKRLGNLGEQALRDLVCRALLHGPLTTSVWWAQLGTVRTGRLRAQPLAMTSRMRQIWPGSDAVLTVESTDEAGATMEARLDGLRSLYGLTPAEARTLRALAAGRSPDEVCAELGVRMPTVRTHIRHLLEKTQSPRLVELVRLANG